MATLTECIEEIKRQQEHKGGYIILNPKTRQEIVDCPGDFYFENREDVILLHQKGYNPLIFPIFRNG